MKRNMWLIIIAAAVVFLLAAFFLVQPESGRQVLEELGLVSPQESGYRVSGILEARVTDSSLFFPAKLQEMMVSAGDRVVAGQELLRVDTTELELQVALIAAQHEQALVVQQWLQADARREDVAVVQALIDQLVLIADVTAISYEDAAEMTPVSVREETRELYAAILEQNLVAVKLARLDLADLEDGASLNELAQAAARVAGTQAALQTLQEMIDSASVKAQDTGVVLETMYLPGEWVPPGAVMLRLGNLDPLLLTVYIPEADLGWVQVGDEVEIRIDAQPDQAYIGLIRQVADMAEFTPRNVQTPEERTILVYAVEIEVANPEMELKPGLPADVFFEELP